MSALLYGRISNPEWKHGVVGMADHAERFGITPSFAYGKVEPLAMLHKIGELYSCLANGERTTLQRAEDAIHLLVKDGDNGEEILNDLPLGIAAPLREATRTCQLSPPFDWSVKAYQAIGRNDLAVGASNMPEKTSNDVYKTPKQLSVSVFPVRG